MSCSVPFDPQYLFHHLHHLWNFPTAILSVCMVSFWRLNVGTWYFHLDILIHFNSSKIFLLISDLSWYFLKWRFTYMGVPAWHRKVWWEDGCRFWSFTPGAYKWVRSAPWNTPVLRICFALKFLPVPLKRHLPNISGESPKVCSQLSVCHCGSWW